MRICTTEQSREIDRLTIEKYGIAGEFLMENAGRALAFVVANALNFDKSARIVVVCGKGNNGGDGFVCARYLLEQSFDVQTVICKNDGNFSPDAHKNLERLLLLGARIADFANNLPQCEVIVDALLGTGFRGEPEAPLDAALGALENARLRGARIFSADIPSGVNGNTGAIAKNAVRAEATVTFGFAKLGHFLHPGRTHTGALIIADINFDARAIAEVPIEFEFSTREEMHALLPPRVPDGHKGTFGKVLVVAGSAGMAGAASFTGESVLRAGAGLCYAAVPRSLTDVLGIMIRELVIVPMPEIRQKRALSLRAIGELLKLAQKVDAIAIGPGLGTNFETRDAIRRFLSKIQLPTIIDADALNALAGGFEDVVPTITAPNVMTPHAGELSRILGISTEQVVAQRIIMAKYWATELFTTLVIKGNPTIIASSQKAVHLNVTGNDGMAKAGAGDVLTGIVSSFAAQGLSVFDAARLGTYVHGLAGDIAARRENHRAMLARHIIDGIGAAFDEIEASSPASNKTVCDFDTDFTISDFGADICALSFSQ